MNHSEETEVEVYCQSELYSLVIRHTACPIYHFTNIYAIKKDISATAIKWNINIFCLYIDIQSIGM